MEVQFALNTFSSVIRIKCVFDWFVHNFHLYFLMEKAEIFEQRKFIYFN